MFILNLYQKIAQRLEKQHSIRQERREGFSDDNEIVYAELKRQLGNQALGDPALPRQMRIDTYIGGLGGSRIVKIGRRRRKHHWISVKRRLTGS